MLTAYAGHIYATYCIFGDQMKRVEIALTGKKPRFFHAVDEFLPEGHLLLQSGDLPRILWR